MNKKFIYKAFGLILGSEFELPELVPAKGTVQVHIKLGETPGSLKQITKRGVRYQATKNEFLLEVDKVATYYIADGKEITIETEKKFPDKELRLFLLGSAFGALFIQRGLLPIHGSTVKLGNTATIFTGLSGVGKSTIAAYFVSKGYQALADDISLINQDTEVVPGFPNFKVWKDVLKELEIQEDNLIEVRHGLKKYHVPIESSFHQEPVELKSVIVINSKNTNGYEYEELSGIRKFNSLKNNTFRLQFIKGLEMQQEHFQLLNDILPKIKVFRVSRPQAPISLDEFGNFILNMIKVNA